MIPLDNPTSHHEEDFHSHDFFTDEGDHVCTIEFDDLEDERGGLWGEMSVTWHLGQQGAMPFIAFERVNLLTKTGAIGKVVARLEGSSYLANWQQGMDVAIYRTIVAYRGSSSEGDWMEWIEGSAEDTPFLLFPWISAAGTTVLFGPPGSNKSMFALRLSLAVALGDEIFGHKPIRSGPVMYLDFEDDRNPQEFRITAFAREMGMEPEDLKGLVYHEKVTKNLKAASRRIRRLVRELGIVMVVVDSIGRARGGDVSASDVTIKMFESLAQLRVPVLAIDHMTKEENKRVWTNTYDAREAMPIGSVYTQASTRLGWFMNVLPDSTDTHKKYNCYNTKHNHVPEQDTRGLEFKASSDEWGNIHNAAFSVNRMSHYVAPVVKRNKQTDLLLWHFSQQREDLKVIPLTLKDMDRSGISSSTIRNTVTDKRSEWWEKVKGAGSLYVLSVLGLEVAIQLQVKTNDE